VSGLSPSQQARLAEANPAKAVSGVQQNTDMNTLSDQMANDVLGGSTTSFGGTGTRLTPFQVAMSQLGAGGGSGSGGVKASDQLARDKWNYEKAQNAASAEKSQRALQSMIDQITSNSYRGNIDTMLGQIDNMNATGTKNINDFYNTGVGNINAGYNDASTMMNKGYADLQSYLGQNPNNPYAGMGAVSTALTNPMQDYLSMYGANSPDVSGQMQAEQLAQQGGTDAFKNLLQVLNANASSNDMSRLAEAKMAGTQGASMLGGQKASYLSQASQAQQQAMAELSNRINQAKFEQEQAAGQRYNSIVDQIIGAGGSIPKPPPPPLDLSNIDLSNFNLDLGNIGGLTR
jgi:hypothetical protein